MDEEISLEDAISTDMDIVAPVSVDQYSPLEKKTFFLISSIIL